MRGRARSPGRGRRRDKGQLGGVVSHKIPSPLMGEGSGEGETRANPPPSSSLLSGEGELQGLRRGQGATIQADIVRVRSPSVTVLRRI